MSSILVVDDHAIFRKKLVEAINSSFPGTDVDEAADGQNALELLEHGAYSLILLDISMPGRGGLEVLRDIKQLRPGVPVLILSMHPEEEYAERSIRAGACGYVAKRNAAEKLAGEIRTALKKGAA